MTRFFSLSQAVRAVLASVLAGGLVLAAAAPPTRAAGTKQLQHVRGTIGWQTAETSTDFKPVFGKFDLPDDNFAVTRAQSAAVLALPDSSLVSLGANTNVQVGAFDTTAAGPGSTITLKGGSLRFDVRRPQGGAANYRFVTTTSAVGVRGTVGLLSFINGVTTVGCVACAADSVTVTVGTQTVTLVTGQFVTVSAAGAIATGAISAVAGTFTAAGVPVTAQTGAVAAGLPASSIAGMSAGTATAVGAAAVVTGTAIGVTASQPTAQPNSNGNSNGSTNAGGSSGTQPGNLNLNGTGIRVPQAAVTPSPLPAAARSVQPGPAGRPHP